MQVVKSNLLKVAYNIRSFAFTKGCTARKLRAHIYQAFMHTGLLNINLAVGDATTATDFIDDQMETGGGAELRFLRGSNDSGSVAEDDNDADKTDVVMQSDLEIYISYIRTLILCKL